MAVYTSKQYDKMDSATIAARRLGSSLVGGYLPARITAPRAKFVSPLKRRQKVTGGLATSWPLNSK